MLWTLRFGLQGSRWEGAMKRRKMLVRGSRFVCIGPRLGWCGHVHSSLRAAGTCLRSHTFAMASQTDRMICGLHAPAMPTGERLRFIVAQSGRPLPMLPLRSVTDFELIGCADWLVKLCR